MSTVRVTCGHVEEGKKVVCEGCFNEALAVVRAAQAVYRGPHRLSKELAPLEYALFASLEPFQAKEEE